MKWWTMLLSWALTGALTVGMLFALCGRGQAEESCGPKYVALTFDDGPKGQITETLLDGLKERGVHASFFLVGSLAQQYPDLVRRMDREGHQIGLHTYDHLAGLTGITRAQFEEQIGQSRAVIQAILGTSREMMLRPPYGQVDDHLRQWAGCPMVLWSVDPEDWYYQDAAKEIESVCTDARDGAIILLHDTFPETVEAALQIVDRLHREGYYFVTVEELLAMNGIEPEAGICYYSAQQWR